jgi:4-hydroxybenzoate polyprenyltransferase
LKKGLGYLRLMRPANIVTAIADVLAGMAISGFFVGLSDNSHLFSVLILCVSTVGLYGGGVVFNDVFDSELDKIERPERPIPSGLVSVAEASFAGSILLLAGIAAAFGVNLTSGIIAVSISAAALIYNKWGKHLHILGPLNMGLCRGLNLLLGISILPSLILNWWYIAFVPVIYIASITMISRGEVHGSSRTPLYTASLLYALVTGFIFYFSFINNTEFLTLVFLLPFLWMIFKPLLSAIKEPSGPNIGKSVKAGVIALILMDAAWAASSGTFGIALIIVVLLPLSFGLSRIFAVT